ncbi:MAG: hypothetical protein IKI84_01045 [Clostridia bacterium]|nr:hypothetical protein [Clostridia bacterium]
MKKNRLTALLLALVLMASILPATALAASFKVGDHVVVSVDTLLRYRSGPGVDHPVLNKYRNGTKATVVEVSPKGLWFRCQVGARSDGWFWGGYLKKDAASSTTPSVAGNYVVSNKGMFVYLRASAGGAIITKVPDGSSVKVISAANGWSYVQFGSNYGYMMSHFLVKK